MACVSVILNADPQIASAERHRAAALVRAASSTAKDVFLMTVEISSSAASSSASASTEGFGGRPTTTRSMPSSTVVPTTASILAIVLPRVLCSTLVPLSELVDAACAMPRALGPSYGRAKDAEAQHDAKEPLQVAPQQEVVAAVTEGAAITLLKASLALYHDGLLMDGVDAGTTFVGLETNIEEDALSSNGGGSGMAILAIPRHLTRMVARQHHLGWGRTCTPHLRLRSRPCRATSPRRRSLSCST